MNDITKVSSVVQRNSYDDFWGMKPESRVQRVHTSGGGQTYIISLSLSLSLYYIKVVWEEKEEKEEKEEEENNFLS